MIVVVGLAFEARIAAGPGVKVICSGNGRNLAASLRRMIAGGCNGLISFGVAGGLAPHLKPGTCIVASAVITGDTRFSTDRSWSSKLLATMPDAVHAALVGAPQPVQTPRDKRALYLETGAFAVDTESHVVATAASDHGLPLAAIRVISDPAGRTLPDVALNAVRPDGTTDVLGLIKSLARRPRELAPLLRTAIDAQAAVMALRRGRRLLGPSLGVLGVNTVPTMAALAEPALGALEAGPPALGSSFG